MKTSHHHRSYYRLFLIGLVLQNQCFQLLASPSLSSSPLRGGSVSQQYYDTLLSQITNSPVAQIPDNVAGLLRRNLKGRALESDTILMEICDVLATAANDQSVVCTCQEEELGDVILHCSEPECPYCSSPYANATCAIKSYSAVLMNDPMRNGGELIESLNHTFQYTSNDMTDRLDFQSNVCPDDDDFECEPCRVYVNGEKCNMCTFCGPRGTGVNDMVLDCENLFPGSSFDLCNVTTTKPDVDDGSIFEALIYESYVCNNESDTSTAPPYDDDMVAEVDINDECSRAIPSTANGELIVGNTSNATYDGIRGCVTEVKSPGLWYSIVGNGSAIRVDTCSPVTDFDTALSIFSGAICGSLNDEGENIDDQLLQCGVANSDGCPFSNSSMVQWIGQEGTTYYIRVHGNSQLDQGTFGLTIDHFEPLANDMCEGAIPLTVGDDAIYGSTNHSTWDDLLILENDDTDESKYESPGVWYYMEAPKGQDQPLQVAVCSTTADVGSVSTVVFKGSSSSCESSLEIVAEGHDDDEWACENGVASVVKWLAQQHDEEDGDTANYYILVRAAESGAVMDFELTVSLVEVEPNDQCKNAMFSLPLGGVSVPGSTRNALPEPGMEDKSCVFDPSLPGVWYVVVLGLDDIGLSVTTCSEELNFDASISVFKGSCNALECVTYAASNEYGCAANTTHTPATAQWVGERSTTYFILIQAVENRGDFALEFDIAALPSNNECLTPTPIAVADGALILGSTQGATASVVPSCGGSEEVSPDVWYSIIGTDEIFVASLCNPQTEFDTQLSIYKMSSPDDSCSSMECVVSSDDACGGGASEAQWETEVGVTYMIRVHGYSDNRGKFGLTVDSLS